MRLGSLMAVAAVTLIALSGCASTGAGNTTYAQYQGAYPQPDLSASSGGGGLRVPY
ncbi:hypothetical protein [Pararhizobium gei]|uniref:hypothetical protein n=1 Tax=Pararhizobium gei TaxID=1395951 RepID=UPI0023D9ECED|nr:hypothetical protein [Rhizobium gei]